MSDNPLPNPPQKENASITDDGPRAKETKTSPSNSSESTARLDTARGGSRKLTLTLNIDDVAKFKADNLKVEGGKVTLSGIDWWITAEIVDGYLSVMLKGSHPNMPEWHCKIDMNVREPVAERSNGDGIFIFTHKTLSWGYIKWMTADLLAANAECFEAMFFGDFEDKNKDVVTLKKVKADDFAEFLKAMRHVRYQLTDKLIDDASLRDVRKASKLKNESKFSKLTWIKLFQEYMRLRDDTSDSESDSDA